MIKPEISIIVPTIAMNPEFHKTYVSIIDALEGVSAEILIINDNKEKTLDLPFLHEKVKVINNLKSGAASARNIGVYNASSDYLLFIDDDMIINKESLEFVLKFKATNKNDCLNIEWDYPPELLHKIKKHSFGRYLIDNGFTSMRGWASDFEWKNNLTWEVPSTTSQFLFISKDNFSKVNGYDESFPNAGFEDYDFPKRLKLKGVVFYISTSNMIYHNEIDKTDVNNWMKRKINGGKTRKVAVNLGYEELRIDYPRFKYVIYAVSSKVYPTLIKLSKRFPNRRSLDTIYFKYINFLLGLSIFKGYNSK